MRLQITAHRHNLPAVHFVYSTASALGQVRTIADLLDNLNKVIPLESSDGEWGLEDYVVEVAATSDQEQTYECLHFQFVKEVLREDDEVIVRGITSEELRQRRQGGRFQITSDGRHLIDGVPFGKRWRAEMARPDVIIPPRKKRRLLPPSTEDEEILDTLSEIEYLPQQYQIEGIVQEDDGQADNSDDDYSDERSSEVEDDYASSSKQSSVSASGKGRVLQINGEARQVVMQHDFDNADNEDTADEEGDDEVDEDEIQQLLAEAAQINAVGTKEGTKPANSVPSEHGDGSLEFTGFSSPTKKYTKRKLLANIGPYTVEDQILTDSDTSSNGSSGSSRSSSFSESTSSSDISSEDEDVESRSGSYTSSSGTSSSNLTSVSSSEENPPEEEYPAGAGSVSGDDSLSSGSKQGETIQNIADQSVQTQPLDHGRQKVPSDYNTGLSEGNPPGSGTKRTKKNNDRVKRRKLLTRLKNEGCLPPEADFDALRAYEASIDPLSPPEPSRSESTTDGNASSLANELELRKKAILAEIKTHEVARPEDTGTNSQDLVASPFQSEVLSSVQNTESPNSSSQRPRLDLASSRRMLFGSLGVRTPKTKEAEDALRAKLSETALKYQNKPPGSTIPTQHDHTSPADENSWKRKLIITAVECTEEGIVMTPPPFPFVQRWDKYSHGSRSENKKPSWYGNETGQHVSADAIAVNSASGTSEQRLRSFGGTCIDTPDRQPSAMNTSDMHDLPLLANYADLPDVTKTNITSGIIIGFRELQMNARYEPEQSDYKVARVIWSDGSTIRLVLSRRDRLSPELKYDDDGNRVYHGLDMPSQDDEIDDGIRELKFEELIAPKLVKAVAVQVAGSSESSYVPEGTSLDQQESEVIPESNGLPRSPPALASSQVRVDTPRREEITTMIQDAGFHSAIDDELLPHTSAQSEQRDLSQDRVGFTSPLVNTHTKPVKNGNPNDLQKYWDSSAAQQRDAASSPLPTSSSPPTISMVETVDYPHVSQIDIRGSSFSERTEAASSSHQDAQRVTPVWQDHDNSNLSHAQINEGTKNIKLQHDTDILAKQSISQAPISDERATDLTDERGDNEVDSSFLGLRGGDGIGSFPSIQPSAASLKSIQSESMSDDDDLPSLRTLNNSQKSRAQTRQAKQISPPPLRKNNDEALQKSKDRKKKKARTLLLPKYIDEISENTGIADHVSTSPMIKISASQQPSLSMSRIPAVENRMTEAEENGPEGINIIELTLPSDDTEAQTQGILNNNGDLESLLSQSQSQSSPARRSTRLQKERLSSGCGESQDGNSRRDTGKKLIRSELAGSVARRNLSGSRSHV